MIGVPKPRFTPAEERQLERIARHRAWQNRSRRPLARTPLMRRTPLAESNPARAARKMRAYRAVLASAHHKQLRYRAWQRSGGLCECEECVLIRGNPGPRLYGQLITDERRRLAFTEIPVWFVKGGGEPWRRFRSKDLELHHDSYALFGEQNPDELRLVRITWKSCHRRIEAMHGTRRRYLRGVR